MKFLFLFPCLLWLEKASGQDKFASLPMAQSRIRSGVVIAPGAICPNRVPAFFVIEGRSLDSKNYVVYSGIKESDCVSICSDNMDKKGKALLCASFTYNSLKKKCYIYREVALPTGTTPLTTFEKGLRYYEKFCLPRSAAVNCGEKPFFREHQSLLVGFAKNVTLESSLEDCASKCVAEGKNCKSAMYFYEEGECIVNSESALTQGEFFVDEEVDRVVYFENGCLLHKQRRSKDILGQKGAVISIVQEEAESDPDSLIDQLLLNEKIASGEILEIETTLATTTKATLPPTTTVERTTVKKTTPIIQLKLRESQSSEGWGVMGSWGAWSLCDKVDGRRIRRRKCPDGSLNCQAHKMESQWCSDLDLSERITPTPSTFAPSERRPGPTERPLRNIMPDLTGRNLIPNSAWGQWSSKCLSFAFEQPCNNRRRLGFQNRQCNGFPFQCEGPFFRYCFMPC